MWNLKKGYNEHYKGGLIKIIGQKKKIKEIKGTHIRKEIKLSLFVDYLIFYVENPKESTNQKTTRANK